MKSAHRCKELHLRLHLYLYLHCTFTFLPFQNLYKTFIKINSEVRPLKFHATSLSPPSGGGLRGGQQELLRRVDGVQSLQTATFVATGRLGSSELGQHVPQIQK